MKKFIALFLVLFSVIVVWSQSHEQEMSVTNVYSVKWSKDNDGVGYKIYNENDVRLDDVVDLGYLKSDDLAVLHKPSRTVILLPSFKLVAANQKKNAQIIAKNISKDFYITNPNSFKAYINDVAETCIISNINGSYIAYIQKFNKSYVLKDIRNYSNWGAKNIITLNEAPENTYWYRDVEKKEYGVLRNGKAIDYSNASSKRDGNNLKVSINNNEKYLLRNYYSASSFIFKPVELLFGSSSYDNDLKNQTQNNSVTKTAKTGCVFGNCVDGWGKWKFKNGDYYDGFWTNSKRQGYGLYNWIGTGKYIGEWYNGEMSGYGVYLAENKDVIKGQYRSGQLNGLGVTTKNEKWEQGYYVNGSLQTKHNFYSTKKNTGCTAGDCNNKYGRYKWSNGDSFTGFFNKGNMFIGTYQFANGDKYSGEFNSSNKFHGMGRYFYKSGAYYGGMWQNGQYNGRGYFKDVNGKEKIGTWSNGILVKPL